ncbi:MAG TPA: PAS domain S-box protein, partial [Pyrinomonadaceae bacterium]|nr:PAS domain S-box protein [Pyrinomonadaceae bacterium]
SVLLVDSTQASQRSIRGLLSTGNNFHLRCASSYRAILDGFRSKAYDVCLIDSDGDSALKLLAQARSLGWTAPIVLVAANNAAEVIGAIRSGFADCLIRKELSLAEIEHSLCSVVEQARSMALLDQRQRRYLALLDNANQIVYTHDLNGALLSINQAGEQLMGYSLAEAVGMDILQLVAPADRVLMSNVIARTLDAQTQMGAELNFVTRYGRKVLVKIDTHPINHDGQTIEIQGVAVTHARLPRGGDWEVQDLRTQDEPPASLVDDGGPILCNEDAAEFPPAQKLSPLSRSLS